MITWEVERVLFNLLCFRLLCWAGPKQKSYMEPIDWLTKMLPMFLYKCFFLGGGLGGKPITGLALRARTIRGALNKCLVCLLGRQALHFDINPTVSISTYVFLCYKQKEISAPLSCGLASSSSQNSLLISWQGWNEGVEWITSSWLESLHLQPNIPYMVCRCPNPNPPFMLTCENHQVNMVFDKGIHYKFDSLLYFRCCEIDSGIYCCTVL